MPRRGRPRHPRSRPRITATKSSCVVVDGVGPGRRPRHDRCRRRRSEQRRQVDAEEHADQHHEHARRCRRRRPGGRSRRPRRGGPRYCCSRAAPAIACRGSPPVSPSLHRHPSRAGASGNGGTGGRSKAVGADTGRPRGNADLRPGFRDPASTGVSPARAPGITGPPVISGRPCPRAAPRGRRSPRRRSRGRMASSRRVVPFLWAVLATLAALS